MKKDFLHLALNQITEKVLFDEIQLKIEKGEPSYLCAVNAHMVVESKEDNKLLNAIKNATWAVADGVPVAWAFSKLNKIKQSRIAGMDITPKLIELSEEKGWTISVFGNTQENLDVFKTQIRKSYPRLKTGILISPPFRKIEKIEMDKYIGQLNACNTDILFVSLGCPKQEKWMLEHSEEISGVCFGIGNAINTFIGQERRAPIFFQRLGMEWLFRLLQNPRRLFRRYLITNTKYLYLITKEMLSFRS